MELFSTCLSTFLSLLRSRKNKKRLLRDGKGPGENPLIRQNLKNRIPLLLKHSVIIRGVPWWGHLAAPGFNLVYRRLCRRVIRTRTRKVWEQAWEIRQAPRETVQKITRIVSNEFCWPCEALFLPDDECHVIFCLWQRKLCDDLALVTCMLRLERELGIEVEDAVISSLGTLTFGEFCGLLISASD